MVSLPDLWITSVRSLLCVPPKKELRIGRKLRRAACRTRKHCAARQRAVWIAVFPSAIAV